MAIEDIKEDPALIADVVDVPEAVIEAIVRTPVQRASDGGSDRPEFVEKVVFINRCAKVVKGGRRFSFSALVVAGDQKGRIGLGFGKAKEVSDAIKKGSEASRRRMVRINLLNNTIPHEVVGEHGGGHVLLKPASPGTGIIAGGGVRAVCDVVGIKDVLAKSLGSSNHSNVVKATLNALGLLRLPDEIFKSRGKKMRKPLKTA
jgi:small subunit ribosomal protein S5